jgi:hypothetical protein
MEELLVGEKIAARTLEADSRVSIQKQSQKVPIVLFTAEAFSSPLKSFFKVVVRQSHL